MKRHLKNTHLYQKERCPFADCRAKAMRKDKLKGHMQKRHGLEFEEVITLQPTRSGEAVQCLKSTKYSGLADTEASMLSRMSMTGPNKRSTIGFQHSAQQHDHNFGCLINPMDYSLPLPHPNSILPSQPDIQVTASTHTTALQISLPLRFPPSPYGNIPEFEDTSIFTDWMKTAFGDNDFDLGVGDRFNDTEAIDMEPDIQKQA